jgi:DNA recombination protein RmuC
MPMPFDSLLVGLVVLVAAFFVGRFLGVARAEKDARNSADAVRAQLAESQKNLAVAQAALKNEQEKYAEKLAAYEKAESHLKETFAGLARNALDSNSQKFLETAELQFKNLQGEAKAELEARKTAIETLVGPLGESLTALDGKVADLENKRVRAYTEVSTQITELASVNRELRSQAGSLVRALSSPNVRGNWGQMQLKRTVEIAGMIEHCDFLQQDHVDTDAGRLRPDMVVSLPGSRRVVVDAKAPRLDIDHADIRSEDERVAYLKTHALKVRQHMIQLANKKYWEQFTPAPEFVVMFLPVEASFAIALQHDPDLLEFGAERRVIPASPLTLIALLQAVNYGWKEACLARDAAKIQELGKGLYNSVRVLAQHLVKMRDQLEGTVHAYNASVGSVERTFLSQARKLKDFHAGGPEEIPELESVDAALRLLEATELRDDVVQTSLIGEFDA